MKSFLISAMLLAGSLAGCEATPAFAQESKPAPVLHKRVNAAPVAPKLSATEMLAVRSLAEKIQANQKERAELVGQIPSGLASKIDGNQAERDYLTIAVKQFEAEIVTRYPGFHFDESKGAIVADTPAPTPPTTPAPEPTAAVPPKK